MGGKRWTAIFPLGAVFSAPLCDACDRPGYLHHFVQQKLLHRWSRRSTDGTRTLFHRRFRTRAQHIWYAARSIFALICLSIYIEGPICHPAMLWLRRDVWRTRLVRSFKQPGWRAALGGAPTSDCGNKGGGGRRKWKQRRRRKSISTENKYGLIIPLMIKPTGTRRLMSHRKRWLFQRNVNGSLLAKQSIFQEELKNTFIWWQATPKGH